MISPPVNATSPQDCQDVDGLHVIPVEIHNRNPADVMRQSGSKEEEEGCSILQR